MQCPCENIESEPISTHPGSRAQMVQHGAYGTVRAAH
jgi:hypothetical protein